MDRIRLQKRAVLSFTTGHYEDGDISYTYVVDVYAVFFRLRL